MKPNDKSSTDARHLRHAIGRVWRSVREWAHPARPVKSYAQQGEDLVLAHLLALEGISKPFYVDIGSNDPVVLSNTYLFYLAGGSGLCVEPNSRYNSRYRRYRPRDMLLNVGVTTGKTTALPYYEMDWPEFNTFDRKQAEAVQATYGGRNSIRHVKTVPLVDVNQLLEEHISRPIDLLSLDVEGLDADILAALDFSRWAPAFICVEHNDLQAAGQTTSQSIQATLSLKGYVLEAHNSINGIYRRETSSKRSHMSCVH